MTASITGMRLSLSCHEKALILAAFPFICLLLLLSVWAMLRYYSQDVDFNI